MSNEGAAALATDAQPTAEGQTLDQQDGSAPAETHYNVADAINNPNITEHFSEVELKEIARECLANFEIDNTNFRSRRDKIEELYKLALQVKEGFEIMVQSTPTLVVNGKKLNVPSEFSATVEAERQKAGGAAPAKK